MKRICKKLSALFLALTIITGSVLGHGLVAKADIYRELFFDDFSGKYYGFTTTGSAKRIKMKEMGWTELTTNTPGNYLKTDSNDENYGEYIVPYNKTTDIGTVNKSGSANWTDYSVEAKLIFDSSSKDDGVNTYGGIAGRISSEGSYSLVVMKQGDTTKLRLRRSGDKIEEKVITDFKIDQPFTLKLEFDGTKIRGCYNDQVEINYDTVDDENKYGTGYAGILKIGTSGLSIRFDDFRVTTIEQQDYPTAHLYHNNFDTIQTLADAGIKGTSTAGVTVWDDQNTNNKCLTVKNNGKAYLSMVVDAVGWEDYTIETDVKLYRGEGDENTTTGYAGLVARTTNESQEGYFYRLGYNNGKGKVILYKIMGSESQVLGEYSLDYNLEIDQSYKMSMSVHNDGNSVEIMCFLEGKNVMDVVDSENPYTSGYAGVRSAGSSSGLDIKYDNFAVKEYVAPTFTYPTTSHKYFNDFNENYRLVREGWEKEGTKVGGAYQIDAGASNYLTGIEDSTTWEDYTVESDVTIVKEANDTRVKGYAGIVARSKNTTSEGYEYRIYYNNGTTRLQLYKRTVSSAISLGGTLIDGFELNKSYKLRMDVHNSGDNAEIMCWFTDVSKPEGEQTEVIFDVVDKKATDNEPYLTGYAGIRSAGEDDECLPSAYDNFAVKEYSAPTYTWDNTEYLYYNDFSKRTRLPNEGWRSEGTKEKGVYKLKGGATNYLTRVTDSASWTNYVVEADVSVVQNDNTVPQYASLVARTTSTSSSGYEYRITKDDTGTFLWLYKRGSDKGLINGKKHVFYKDGLEITDTNKLKMVVVDNEIICYLDGELIFEVIDNTDPYLAGYTGVRSPGDAAESAVSTYDNYVVRPIKDGDLPTNAPYEDEYLYYNDFSTRRDLSKEGWTNTGDKTGEVYTLAGSGRNYLTNVAASEDYESSADWDNYVVEADVSIIDDGTLPQHASITARCDTDENRGYEYRITKEESGETCLWLYKRPVGSGKINGELQKFYMDIDVTIPHKMKMVVNGNEIICYFDGELIFEVIDEEAYTKGYAGVRSATGTADSVYDNYTVRKIKATDLPTNDGLDEEYLYVNNFSTRRDLTKEGWHKSGTKENGLYLLPGKGSNYLTNVEGSADWTDYVVEADVKVINDEHFDDADMVQKAVLAARSSNLTNEGYECSIGKTKDGTQTYVELLKRKDGTTNLNGKSYYRYYTDIDITESHHLKMVVNGSDIICYLDDELVIEVTDEDPYTKGYAGVRATGTSAVTYGNYVVRKIKSTDVPTGAVYEEGVLYSNDFSSNRDITKEGWLGRATKKDGVFVLKAGSNDYLANVNGASEWTDYVVEADIMINEPEIRAMVDNTEIKEHASIVARTTNTSKEGYEFRIHKDNDGYYVWLYKRGSDKGYINGKKYQMKIGIVPGEMNAVKMVVSGANILCYFDGMKIFDVIDEEPYLKGYTGIRSPEGALTSTYDNYVVREIQYGDIVKDKVIKKLNNDVWFYDDFKAESSLSQRGWNTDKVDFYGGSVVPIGRLYVDGVEDCANWTDYEVSVVVCVDKAAGLQEGYSNGKSAICARSLSSTTGYEYGIVTIPGSPTYLRLYDRATDKILAENKSIKVTEGEHTLSMTCVGNDIYCFFDGELAFTATCDSAANGYAGVRASGYNTYYKNFAIKKANVVATTVKPGTVTGGTTSATSPQTGMSVAYQRMMNFTAAAFVFSAIAMVVTFSYSRREE